MMKSFFRFLRRSMSLTRLILFFGTLSLVKMKKVLAVLAAPSAAASGVNFVIPRNDL